VSAGDARRRYVRLTPAALPLVGRPPVEPPSSMLFLCTRNSARSQLAAAVWTARTGAAAASAGTQPASKVHRGAVAAARRAGLNLDAVVPRRIEHVPTGTQVVTVCDLVHEELQPQADWWHWSITDPVDDGSAAAFDAVVAELNERIDALAPLTERSTP
jgi:protein-tyrosine-phosphatase